MSDGTRPVSSGPSSSAIAKAVVVLFFFVFFAAGAAFGIGVFGRPLWNMLSARNWQSASCEITSSRVETRHSSDGSSFRVDVTYRYFVDDRPYVGNRYQFMGWSTTGFRGKAVTVNRLRPGTRSECWVNPDNPSDAVIERGPTVDLWFGLIPLVFITIGGGGMYFAAFGRDRVGQLMSAKSTTKGPAYTKAVRGAEPAALRPRYSRGAKLAGGIAVALFWNGIVSVFLYNLTDWGVLRWFVALFLIPFVLIGFGLVGLVIYQALQLANPRPTVTVNKPIVTLGDELRVDWSMDGRVGKLTRFSITLEAREEATYTRGTDRTTETSVFMSITLVNHIPPEISRAGSAKVKIPADTMHSFDATHNKVVWVLRVRGELPRWPNSDEEFPLTVAPYSR